MAVEPKFALRNQRFLRREEVTELQRCWGKAVADECVQVVLIHGESGMGKTTLAEMAFQSSSDQFDNAESQMDDKRIFVAAKCEEKRGFGNSREEAKQSIVDMVHPLKAVRNLLAELIKTETVCEILRSAAKDFPVQQYTAIIALLPDRQRHQFSQINHLTIVEEEEDEEREEDNWDNVNKNADMVLKLALRKLFDALLSSPSSPSSVVLWLDDVMWCDTESLEALHFVLSDRSLKRLMFCGTYRSRAALTEDHPLLGWIQTMQKEEEAQQEQANRQSLFFSQLSLGCVSRAQIQDFLALSLHQDQEKVGDLAEYVEVVTQGNPFYIIQMLERLQSLHCIRFEFISSTWTYSLDTIKKRVSMAESVGELVASRIRFLPADVQDVLKLASCFGTVVDAQNLLVTKSIVTSISSDETVLQCLEKARDEHFLIQLDDSSHYKFAHDQILTAAYEMLPPGDERAAIHWKIGNILTGGKMSDMRSMHDSMIFSTCDHFSHSLGFVEQSPEKVSRLFLEAGTRAVAISAFVPATEYFRLGIRSLGQESDEALFRMYNDLASKLYVNLARAEYCTGQQHKTFEKILAYSKDEAILHCAFLLKLKTYLAENKLEEHIRLAIDLLKKSSSSEKVCMKPHAVRVAFQKRRLNKMLHKLSGDDLSRLPRIEDKEIEDKLFLLREVWFSSHHANMTVLHDLVVVKIVRITLNYGISRNCAQFVVSLLCSLVLRDDPRKASEYLSYAKTFENQSMDNTALFTLGAMTGILEPSTRALDYFLNGYQTCINSGDILNGMICVLTYFWSYVYSGTPFLSLLSDVEKFSFQMLEYKQIFAFRNALPVWQFLLNLSGRSEDPLDLENGDAIEMGRMVGGNPGNIGKETKLSYGMQLAMYHGKLERATTLCEQLPDPFKDMNSMSLVGSAVALSRLFMVTLVSIANCRSKQTLKSRSRYMAKASKQVSTLRDLVKNGGYLNYVHRYQICEAEFASLKAATTKKSIDPFQVRQMYETGVTSATRSGFLQDAAFGSYLAAEFCARHEPLTNYVKNHITTSVELFESWGATAVADSVKARHPNYFDGSSSSLVDKGTGFKNRERFRESIAAIHHSLSREKVQ